jgi:hypothetical protein
LSLLLLLSLLDTLGSLETLLTPVTFFLLPLLFSLDFAFFESLDYLL